MRKIYLTVFVLFLGSIHASQAATLVWDTGAYQASISKLAGANDVLIGHDLYNVRFLDGSCISLYSGCDSPDDFAVYNLGTDPALALREQVFNSDLGGLFEVIDTTPGLTVGCKDIPVDGVCDIYTPIDPSGGGPVLLNFNEKLPNPFFTGVLPFDVILKGIASPSRDTSGIDNSTMAVWSAVNPVPIPAAVWLFGTALMGLVGFSKRKKQDENSS